MFQVEETPFNSVIGYDAIKEDLCRLAYYFVKAEGDLRNSLPKMVLLHGKPGVGKSMLIDCFVRTVQQANPSSTYYYSVKPNACDFVEAINCTFIKVGEGDINKRSVIVIEDLDKFSNNDEMCKDTKEFFAIQSHIDSIENGRAVILASVNDLGKLPDSLVRPGRCDYLIEVGSRASGFDGNLIAKKYLSELKFESAILDDLSILYETETPAKIKSDYDKAKLSSFINGKTVVSIDDMLDAYLGGGLQRHKNYSDYRIDEEKRESAIHEAGHLIVAEALNKGSIAFATIMKSTSFNGIEGFVKKREFYTMRKPYSYREEILYSLGGYAAQRLPVTVKKNYNELQGSESDIYRASELLEYIIGHEHALGMYHVTSSCLPTSQADISSREIYIQRRLEEYVNEATNILMNNKDRLENAYYLLLEKGYLVRSDIDKL